MASDALPSRRAGAQKTGERPTRGRSGAELRYHRSVPFKLEGARAVPSVCPYCAVGCGLLVHVRDGRIVNIEGDPASPINQGEVGPIRKRFEGSEPR
jgi:formate dehydrogenase major subunit